MPNHMFWRSEVNMVEWVLYFHHMVFRPETELGSSGLPESVFIWGKHLDGPFISFVFVTFIGAEMLHENNFA